MPAIWGDGCCTLHPIGVFALVSGPRFFDTARWYSHGIRDLLVGLALLSNYLLRLGLVRFFMPLISEFPYDAAAWSAEADGPVRHHPYSVPSLPYWTVCQATPPRLLRVGGGDERLLGLYNGTTPLAGRADTNTGVAASQDEGLLH